MTPDQKLFLAALVALCVIAGLIELLAKARNGIRR